MVFGTESGLLDEPGPRRRPAGISGVASATWSAVVPRGRWAAAGGGRAGRGVPGAATGARASAAVGDPEPKALQLSSGGRNSVATLRRWPAPSCDKPHRPGAATRRHSAACRRARAFRRPGRGIGAPAARERRAATPGGRRPARRAATPGGRRPARRAATPGGRRPARRAATPGGRRAGRGVPGAATGARASAAGGNPSPRRCNSVPGAGTQLQRFALSAGRSVANAPRP
jgi:hypothetical protein